MLCFHTAAVQVCVETTQIVGLSYQFQCISIAAVSLQIISQDYKTQPVHFLKISSDIYRTYW